MSVQCASPISPEQVTTAFLSAAPYFAKEILDLTVKRPMFTLDVPKMTQMPLGEGSTIEQLVFRGSMPEIERGFDKWRAIANNSGCDLCPSPDCSYLWTEFPASAWERKRATLQEREFKTPAYCVKAIQTTRDFENVFNKIVQIMYQQTTWFKELNIVQNLLTGLSKKFVVDSNGPRPNTENPYVYRAVGAATLSALNITLLEFFYEQMRRMVDVEPYDMVDGSPLYGMQCSQQLISHMYRDDQSLRWDARFSSAADDLLTKYNFQSTIRSMFIPASIQYPRRFNLNAGGEVEEVLPVVNGIPGEVGTYTGPNPAYEMATFEEVLLHGRDPFEIAWRPTTDSLGSNTSFGPDGAEPGFMDYWAWINPQTNEDPFRRVGYFATAISLGVLPQYSEGMFGVLVARPNIGLTAMYMPVPSCPPEAPVCDNSVPDVSCPCGTILTVTANPLTAGQYFFNLAVPLDDSVEPLDVIQLGIATGGYINATIVSAGISADRLTFAATLPDGVIVTCNDFFTTLFCDNTLGCYSDVITYSLNCDDATRVNVYLEYPIKADTAADVVTVYFGDGTTSTTATVVSVDMTQNLWVIDLGATNFCDQVGGVAGICVPTATDATCPACGFGPTVTQCEEA